MPAVVCRMVNRKTKAKPYAIPSYEWLTWHDLTQAAIAAAMEVIARGDQPAPRQVQAEWGEDGEALLFTRIEAADAVARLVREEQGDALIYAAIRNKPMPVRVPQCVIPELPAAKPEPVKTAPRRGIGAKYRRAHSPSPEALERDWHQRAVNSGGQD